ncbi:nucleotidyltransferase family protein [Streptacidiphilus sp. PB12-B1b]|uniref:hypothetical protein n=1 Tax=Streptacidiphilus sp. PB12-B1b TaxID=2705012 RepID=UPI0015FB0356|nr:hypothetical protein [Streptacidiphilus sp. PB12-B1b]QMU77881.1 nucleotidyltransferase family protein [Streptacidiphilus sp. PB12-B1b]
MTEVSTGTVRELLGLAPQCPRETVLGTARAEGHKLAATLLSLWAAEGAELTAAQARELAACRERIDDYRQFWDGLHKLAPETYLLKGMTVAALYPPGILRSAGDLDVVCPHYRDFWACARHLAETGWELEALTFGPARAGDSLPHHLMAEFRRPSATGEPYAVGLVTAEIVTDVRRPAWQLARPVRSPLAASAVALVAERWERPFRSRDLLDLMLLLGELDRQELAQVAADLARTGLLPQWREAMRRIARLGWSPPATVPAPGAAVVRARLLRAAGALRRWSSPVRLLAAAAQAGVEEQAGRLADTASDLLHRWAGPRRALAAGVPLFAVPLDGAPGPEWRLDDVGRQLVARTPIGSFLLVCGAARQEWLDEASGGAPSATEREL